MHLKPCPFCGRQPKESSREAAPDLPYRFVAFRVCYGGGYSAHAHIHGVGDTPTEASLDADAKWNNRI